MERTMIAWNLPNWITILLMAAAGYLVLLAVSQALGKTWGGGSDAS